jgi:hypothetical protein
VKYLPEFGIKARHARHSNDIDILELRIIAAVSWLALP